MAPPIKNPTEDLTNMDLDTYLTFAMASMLISIGVIFLSLTVILLNNLLHKYWKTVRLVEWLPNPRFAEPQEVLHINKSNEPHLKEVK